MLEKILVWLLLWGGENLVCCVGGLGTSRRLEQLANRRLLLRGSFLHHYLMIELFFGTHLLRTVSLAGSLGGYVLVEINCILLGRRSHHLQRGRLFICCSISAINEDHVVSWGAHLLILVRRESLRAIVKAHHICCGGLLIQISNYFCFSYVFLG